MLRLTTFSFLSCLILAHTTSATTWIVDAAGGPGTNFTDLPPALATAQSGDLILVRPGVYSASRTSKGVSILAERGAELRGAGMIPALRVETLAAGESFVLTGMSFQGATTTSLIDIQNCTGRVHFDQLDVRPWSPASTSAGISILSAREVSIRRSTIECGIEAIASSLLLSENQIHGRDADPNAVAGAGPALYMVGGRLFLTAGTLRGGAGTGNGGFGLEPQPALDLLDVDGWIAGDGTTVISAGVTVGSASASALKTSTRFGTFTELIIDPHVTLIPSGGAPAIDRFRTSVTMQRIPALRIQPVAPGNDLAVDLYSPAGDLVILFASLPGDLSFVAGGLSGLDATSTLLIAFATQGPSEHWSFTLPIPGNAALRGVLLRCQAASAQGTQVRLSGPETLVLG